MGPIPRCGARAAAESISRAGRIGVIICSRELTCFNLDDHDVIVTVRVTVNCPGAVSHSACQCHDDRLSEPGRRQSNNLNSNSPLVAVRPLEKKLELECRYALRHSSSEARISGQQPTKPRRPEAGAGRRMADSTQCPSQAAGPLLRHAASAEPGHWSRNNFEPELNHHDPSPSHRDMTQPEVAWRQLKWGA